MKFDLCNRVKADERRLSRITGFSAYSIRDFINNGKEIN